MKQFIYILFTLSIVIACGEQQAETPPINLSAEQIDSVLNGFQFTYQSPIVLDSADYVLIPISTTSLKKKRSLMKRSYSEKEYSKYWNVIFYNKKTGATKLLTENKVNIAQIYAKQEEHKQSNSRLMDNKVLYQMRYIDFNEDKKLNSKDPEFLFISEPDGTKLTRLSPQSEDLQYFEVISNSTQILLQTLRDVNQDSIFNYKDEPIWYKVDQSNNQWTIAEVIDSTDRKAIEKLYFEQWLQKQ